jgi:hypothetical protein
MSLLTGPNGDVSSKRVASLALITAGIVLAFLHPDQAVMVGTLLGTGTAILGVQAMTKT